MFGVCTYSGNDINKPLTKFHFNRRPHLTSAVSRKYIIQIYNFPGHTCTIITFLLSVYLKKRE